MGGEGLVQRIAQMEALLARLKKRMDIQIVELECRVAEEWAAFGPTPEERHRFSSRTSGLSKPELLAALRGEWCRLQRLNEMRQELERKLSELSQTEQKSGQFEQGVSANKDRLRGSSMQLVKEERARMWYRKVHSRLREDCAQLAAAFEDLSGKVFLHGGMPVRESLDSAKQRVFAPSPRLLDVGDFKMQHPGV